MALQVGRAGGDATLPLPSPTTIDRDGDRVRFRGNLWVDASGLPSPSLGRVLRDQVIGLDPSNSPGMPVRPVIYTPGEISRYGRVIGASAPSSRAAEATGVWPYDIEVEWATGGFAPLIEERTVGALRTQPDGTTNAAAIASNTSIAVLGAGVDIIDITPPPASNLTRTGADGAVFIGYGGTNRYFDSSATWLVSPANYYKGAVNIQLSRTGTPLNSTTYSVVGREIPNYPTGWAIQNSLVAVLGSATAGVGEFTMLWHDGTSYESSKTFRVTITDTWSEGGSDLAASLVRVVANSPELCVLRVYFGSAATTAGGCHIDFALRRGSRHVSCLLAGQDGYFYGIKLVTGEALTAITGGARATNNDASGNKLILASPQTHTLDTTNGRIRLTSTGTKFAFGIGAAIGGTVGTAINETQGIAYEYFAAVTGEQRAVIP